jgi:hypothetical protein
LASRSPANDQKFLLLRGHPVVFGPEKQSTHSKSRSPHSAIMKQKFWKMELFLHVK